MLQHVECVLGGGPLIDSLRNDIINQLKVKSKSSSKTFEPAVITSLQPQHPRSSSI